MVQVPAEIVSYIVDQLGVMGDDQTLKACNLTSKIFRLPTQKNIFYRIDIIVNPAGMRRLRLLREILTASPNIGSYVKVLALGLLPEKRATNPIALMLLAMFPSIECLSIQNAERWYGWWAHFSGKEPSSSWHTLSTEMQSAILNLLSLPTVHTIHLKGITQFPLLTLYRCRHLLELDLHFNDVEPDLSEEILATDKMPPIPLKRLELVSNSKVHIEQILRHLFLLPRKLYWAEDLVKFTLIAEGGTNMDVVQCIIDDALKRSLTHIWMDLSMEEVDTRHLDLSAGTKLKSLWLGRASSPLGVKWITESLASLSFDNPLRRLTIRIEFDLGGAPTDGLVQRLDNELASLENFRDAKIDLVISSGRKSVLDVMRYWLPKTAMMDNLTVMAGKVVVDLSGL